MFYMATQDSGPAERTGQEVLDSCAKGDLDLLKEMLVARPQGESTPSSHDMLVAACNAKHPQTVQFLLQKYPSTETSQKLHEAAMAGGIPVYEIILSKYPELKDHSFGHTCDPIGQAVENGDLEMVKFLLNQGFDVQMAHFCYIPVLTIAIGNEASEEMIEVLKQHGAPEGQELPALNPSASSGSED